MVIAGQGTVAFELLQQWNHEYSLDYVFVPVGG
jgi:threonine dehydratase